MAAIIRERRDTAANWALINPVIPDGQLVFETDTDIFKIGNGISPYSELIVQSGSPGVKYSGAASIDFGSESNEAAIAITGQTLITTDSVVTLSVDGGGITADHDAEDHRYLPTFASFTVGAITPGVGFTIYGRSTHQLDGTFKIKWSWTR
jgi:hypothetical protein